MLGSIPNWCVSRTQVAGIHALPTYQVYHVFYRQAKVSCEFVEFLNRLTRSPKNAMLPRVKVYLSTLGCKLNESELEAWARRFAKDGYEVVDDPQSADMVVLNTCTVTHVAARKSRQMARQLARTNPNARLVLTGCYASVAPDEAKKLPNVSLVVPNAEKDRLVERISDLRFQNSDCAQNADVDLKSEILNLKSEIFHLRTRAFVKIEDGCNMSCTYCIIPIARGKERSRSMADVVSEIKSLVDTGYKEIILTGVQISSYRPSVTPALAFGASVASEAKQSPTSTMEIASPRSFDSATDATRVAPLRTLLAMTNLRDLVAAILSETAVPRLRLTSIAPWEVDEALLDLFDDSRLCRHLHLSLQCGSDTVLRRMRRPYTTAQFARAVESVRAKIPDVGITADVIVGFPGESQVEFEQSLEFVEQMQFSRVHVFPYSARAGTVAASLPLQISDSIKASRMKQMQTIADLSMRAFAERFVGRELPVLWESKEQTKDDGRKPEDNFSFVVRPPSSVWSGYTDNYIRVVAPSEADLGNTIAPARLVRAIDDGAIGEIIDASAS